MAPVPRATARPWLLGPVDPLVRRLRNSARLAVLVVLLVVPAALANGAFATTITSSITFTDTERTGVAVLRPALTALAAVTAGGSVDLGPLRTAVQAQPALDTGPTWAAVQTAAGAAGLGAVGAAPAARAALASALVDLITQVGNASNLILDPDLDSFYVMDALVVQVPRLLLTAAQAAAPDGGAARTARVAAQAVGAGTIAGAATNIASDAATATGHTALPDLASRCAGLARVTQAGQSLAAALSGTLDAPAPAGAAGLSAVASAAADLGPAVTALDDLLARRSAGFAHQRAVTLGVTLAALALACWFAAGVWWRTRHDVGQVVAAVTAISENDLDERPMPAGRDESGDIGRAVAVARSQLAQARDALQQAQAAREAQMHTNFVQQRLAERQARERAQQVIDETSSVVVTELTDVVHQVDAVRTAASTIDSRVRTADAAARGVVDQAREADRMVAALAGSLSQVQSMAKLIAGIADQTRLLALNATIEAARAGSAGRGFSVVAQEVKNLAVTTAQSTGDITQTIASLQSDAGAVAAAITQMSTGIVGVDEATAVLGNVATEQHALVERLDRCVGDAMHRVQAMAAITDQLERRRHERVPALGDVALQFHDRVVDARLADLSTGGVRCVIDSGDVPAVGDVVGVEVVLGDGPATLQGQVIRCTSDGPDAQVGVEFLAPDPRTAERLHDHVAHLSPLLAGRG